MSEDVREIAEELVVACERTYIRDIQTGSGGNVSARVPGRDLMIMRANSDSFINSTPEGFVITDFDENPVEGEGRSTREALLHGLLYRIYPKVNAAVYTHSLYSITWASAGKALEKTTWHTRLKMNANLPTLDIPAAMVKKEYFPMVEEIYRESSDLLGLLLVGHDLMTVRKDAINTGHTAELVGETAQAAILKVTVSKLGL